jgi:hypothetical protein
MVEQPEPDGRHPGADGDLFCLEQLVEAGAVVAHAREDQLGADQRRDIGKAPGADVEHGHDH